MQPMKRRVVPGPSLNLVARSFNRAVNPKCDSRSVPASENVVVDKSCQQHALKSSGREISGSVNGNLELLQPQVARWNRIEKAILHYGFSAGISWKNPETEGFSKGHDMICGFSVKESGFPIRRPVHAFGTKLVSSGPLTDSVLAKWLRKDIRGGCRPFAVDSMALVRGLHTEIRGEKHVDAKSEKVAIVRNVRSSVKTKVSTSKKRRMVGRVLPIQTTKKSVVDSEVPNPVSVTEKEVNLVPASSTEVESESQMDTEEERGTAWQDALRGMDGDDLEESLEGFGERRQIVQTPSGSTGHFQHVTVIQNEELSSRASAQAMALLRAALDEADEEEEKVEVEFQRSLRVGIVGAPNAGKSLLTNQLVGSRVSAVSRKTNTTHRDHLGVFTKGDTQLLYYDTPGLHLDIEGSPLRVDAQHRVRNAWEIVDSCEALVVVVDAERQIRRPDKRVQRLVEKLGKEEMVSQQRVLCLNKVDIIENKRTLLPLAKHFEDLHGYDRIFMISGFTGSGVKDVTDYLVNQAVLRPWDEDPENKDHRDIALEVVREQVFEHLHEEVPHFTRQKLVSWKVLKDGSIRIQQDLLVATKDHRKILVGTKGAVIGDIGIKARMELTAILGTTVHLVLDVKLMTDNDC